MTMHYDDLFGYKITITLTCKTCGTEWVPSTKGAGYGAELKENGRFDCGIVILDPKCPVCDAHEAVIADFRRMREQNRRQ